MPLRPSCPAVEHAQHECRDGQAEEHRPAREVPIADAQVCDEGTEEIQHQTGCREGAEHWYDESGEQAECAGGEQRAEGDTSMTSVRRVGRPGGWGSRA